VGDQRENADPWQEVLTVQCWQAESCHAETQAHFDAEHSAQKAMKLSGDSFFRFLILSVAVDLFVDTVLRHPNHLDNHGEQGHRGEEKLSAKDNSSLKPGC